MVRPKKTKNAQAKNASLLTAVVILLMSFTYVPDWSAVGVAEGSPLAARFVYPFFMLPRSTPLSTLGASSA